MGDVTVGVDIGTTSVKALAVDGAGAVVASARCRHRVVAGPDRLEHDADAAWHRGVVATFAEVARGRTVRGVSVAAMVPSLTAVGRSGRPCAAGLLYGDARGGGELGGGPAESGEAGGFLRWLATEHPDAEGFWPAQAVANHALSGHAAIDYATAYCLAPLFDGTTWAPDALPTGVLPTQLPAVIADVSQPAGRVDLHSGRARDAGPVAGATEAVGHVAGGGPVVGAGTVDALAAQYVLGADEPGDVLVLLGATLIVWLVTSSWEERPGLWTVPHTAPGRCLLGGASNSGGLFVDWAGSILAPGPPGSADPADVPVWLPYARGERTPLHDPSRRAEISGLHLGHDAAALERATYEASGFVVRHILDRAGLPARRIVAAGGGARRPGWVAALADCTGLPVDVAAVPDASALGSAFLARCAAGLESSPVDGARWARTVHRIDPDPGWQAACADRYAEFRNRTEASPRVPGARHGDEEEGR